MAAAGCEGKMKNASPAPQLDINIELEILSYLPALSVVRFRSVCKAWEAKTRELSFIKTHFARSQKQKQQEEEGGIYPSSFLFHYANKDTPAIFRLVHHHRVYDIPCDELFQAEDYEPKGSCNGLLLLQKKCGLSILYNPLTKEHRCLYEEENHTGSFSEYFLGFGFDSVNNQYKVLKTGHYHKVSVCTIPTSGGQPSWRLIDVEHHKLPPSRQCAVCVNGRLHWLRFAGGTPIISFDLQDEQFHDMPSRDTPTWMVRGAWHLTKVQGCLAMVVSSLASRTFDVWVMREYGNDDSWTRSFRFKAALKYISRHPIPMFSIKTDEKHLLYYEGDIYSYDPVLQQWSIAVRTHLPIRSQNYSYYDLTVLPFQVSLVAL